MSTRQKVELLTVTLVGIAVAAFVAPIWETHFLDWIPEIHLPFYVGPYAVGILFLPLIVRLGFTTLRLWKCVPLS
jgi:hypothetical protein